MKLYRVHLVLVDSELHTFMGINTEYGYMLEDTEEVIITGNIGYTKRREVKKANNTICVGHHYKQTQIM